MPQETQRAKTSSCANCGDPVSAAGPTPKSGLRFCATKRDCINAKQRMRYTTVVLGTGAGRMEYRRCSCCNDPLPVRRWRATDSELGRWCRKSACQRARAIVEDQARRDSDPAVREARELAIRNAFANLKDVRCYECGREDSRQGFIHPRLDDTKQTCMGTGENIPPRDLAFELWLPDQK